MTPEFSPSPIDSPDSNGVAPAPLLTIRDLTVRFDRTGQSPATAVDGLSLTVYPGQTLALVGESGCGKSVTALSILRLLDEPTGRIDGGTINFDGRDLRALSPPAMRDVRGSDIAMIFQEPRAALNPVFTVGEQIIEAIQLRRSFTRRQARAIALDALREVGIEQPERRLDAYPHEFSGGMCQRVMTAIALARKPRLLIADEPTTALDVTIQAQVLDLLQSLQRSRGMSVLLITHDLGVVVRAADIVCVMYAGRCVEYATVTALFAHPMHPYTRGLFSSIPKLNDRRPRLRTVAELMNDPQEFRRLPDGLVPWWPSHPPPALVSGNDDDEDRDTSLIEIEPRHWIACWRTEFAAARPITTPDLSAPRCCAKKVG